MTSQTLAHNKFHYFTGSISITQKILMLFAILITLITLTQGQFLIAGNSELIIEQQFRLKLLEERVHAENIFQSIDQAHRDLSFLSSSPAVAGIVRASKNRGIDPIDNSAIVDLKHRLQSMFVTIAGNTPEYFQIRFIGLADAGREIVRVDRQDEKVFVVADDRLQQKSHRDYFQETIKLGSDEIYTSRINLNRDNGEITTPYMPTLRLAKPVFSEGNMFGFVIININFAYVLDSIASYNTSEEEIYIINEKGDYLSHPDKSKTFAFDFGVENNIQQDIESVAEILHADEVVKEKNIIYSDNNNENLVQFLRLDIDPANQDRFIALVHKSPTNTALRHVYEIRNKGILITGVLLIIGIFLALFFCRIIVNPIKKLTISAQNIACGKYDTNIDHKSSDEIGVLSKAFSKMIDGIKSREQSIREKEARYRAIFTKAQESIVITDESGKIEEANPSTTKAFGYEEHELIGNRFDLLYPSPETHTIQGNSFPILKDNYRKKAIARHKRGFDIPTFISVSKLVFETGSHFSTIIHNLTEQEKAREDRKRLHAQLIQAQKMESIGQVVSGLSHDFNNVLNSIIGRCGLAKFIIDKKDINDVKEELDEISKIAGHGSDIIRQMLIFCREQKMEIEPIDATKATAGAINMIRSMIPSTIALEYTCHDNIPPVLLNSVQLQQVLLNLCINARDAITSTGKISISIHNRKHQVLNCSSCHQEIGGKFVEIRIEDSGQGISENQIERIFEPFYSSKDKGMGTGMGLAMVHGLIHSAGGHICVKSTPGEGSTFQLLLLAAEETSAVEQFS